nr:SymE family type I addiction module toxin [uncultured Enterobacter sp.]
MSENTALSAVNISKALRHLKVSYVRKRHENRKTKLTRHYTVHPSLSLQGIWLEEAGFTTGAAVSVSVEFGQLIIRTATE